MTPEQYASTLILLAPLLIVDLVLRGIALYKSARRGQKAWFIALLIVNSLGILPAIYLVWFSRKLKR